MLFPVDKFPNILQESSFTFNGTDYLFFEDKVDFYSLASYKKRKIQSFQELVYCMEVILYLNPTIIWDDFLEMGLWVSDRTNGKTIRTYGEQRVKNALSTIYDRNNKPFVNNKRRVVFNPKKNISMDEKLSIVGQMCGGRKKQITSQDIYDVVEELMVDDIKIRLGNIATALNVTRQTISNNITPEIKSFVKDYNDSLV